MNSSPQQPEPATGADNPEGDGLVMRPITNPTAIELARQLIKAGQPGIELHPDGTLWARGVERRRGPRTS